MHCVFVFLLSRHILMIHIIGTRMDFSSARAFPCLILSDILFLPLLHLLITISTVLLHKRKPHLLLPLLLLLLLYRTKSLFPVARGFVMTDNTSSPSSRYTHLVPKASLQTFALFLATMVHPNSFPLTLRRLDALLIRRTSRTCHIGDMHVRFLFQFMLLWSSVITLLL